MKKTGMVILLLVSGLMVVPSVFAGCPEGKVPILMTTPSGNQKTICVSDNAIQGIERAAENSESILIPSACPCWNDSDIDDVIATYSNMFCVWEPPPIMECVPGYPAAMRTLNCYTGTSKVEYEKCLSTSTNPKEECIPPDENFVAFQVEEYKYCNSTESGQLCRNDIIGTEYDISTDVETACVEIISEYVQ